MCDYSVLISVGINIGMSIFFGYMATRYHLLCKKEKSLIERMDRSCKLMAEINPALKELLKDKKNDK